MAIQLPALPYGAGDLEPHMSQTTILTHHGKHHKAYVDKANDLIKGSDLDHATLEDIILASFSGIGVDPKIKNVLFNNSAQVYNHTFFWNSMSVSGGGEPTDALLSRINTDFGSYAKFLSNFKDCALKQFGSGWCWLIWNSSAKKLEIESTSNAGTPITSDNKKPILTVDVWEHAYYLDHKNMRLTFLDVFLQNLVNWNFASANFSAVS